MANSTDAPKKSRQVRTPKRISVDFDPEQYEFLQLFIQENGVKMSSVLRTLWYRLEKDEDFANEIIDTIFSEENDE